MNLLVFKRNYIKGFVIKSLQNLNFFIRIDKNNRVVFNRIDHRFSSFSFKIETVNNPLPHI